MTPSRLADRRRRAWPDRPPVLALLGGLLLLATTLARSSGVVLADPAPDSWTPLATAGAPSPRYAHTAVWTGSEMLVWGGLAAGVDRPPLANGAAYNPATATWRPLSLVGAPGPRASATAIWTGHEMLVWGGNPGGSTGAAYNPITDTWRPLPISGARSRRVNHTAVWTGEEMLIWGGAGNGLPADAGAYNPATDTWRTLAQVGAPAPREQHAAVWTGTEMLVWGGRSGSGPYRGDGGAYNPRTDTWRSLAQTDAPTYRIGHTAVWTGTEMVIWGGGGGPHNELGAAYDPRLDTWRPIATNGAPSPRSGDTAVWTGTDMVVWGGKATAPLGDGARYNPTADVWAPLPRAQAPSPRALHTAVWTGTEMLVWGGTGDRYTPGPNSDVRADGSAYVPGVPLVRPEPAPVVPHDARYFPETGYRIDNDPIWNYFNSRGRIDSFGLPVSRTFNLQGCQVQIFQRQVAQVCDGSTVQLINLLDPETFPYTSVNGSTLPGPDDQLKNSTPKVSDPNYATAILAFVRANAPDAFNGQPVSFGLTFFNTVTPQQAGTSDTGLLGLFGLEIWGAPISRPQADPANNNFIYQRFQRGIMHYTAGQGTRAILLADYLKQIFLGPGRASSLPTDLAQQAQGSKFFGQYCPGAPSWLCRPNELIGTDLTFAFEPD